MLQLPNATEVWFRVNGSAFSLVCYRERRASHEGNVIAQVRTQPSAPALANFASPIQNTAVTLPAAAFLIAMAFPGFAMLYT